MNRFIRKACPRERGAAAVELALVLPILLVVMAPLILYARYMWHYTVAQKAAQDAARYMSTVSVVEMKSKKLTVFARSIAAEIARREVADLAPGEAISSVDVLCDTHVCGSTTGSVPTTVNVFLSFHLTDTIFNMYMGPYGIPIEANVTMRYVGK